MIDNRIPVLEARIRNQRVQTRELDKENKRLRDFVKSMGQDPDNFRYDDRFKKFSENAKSQHIDMEREMDRRRDCLESVIRLLEAGLPVTALENAKDYLRSMSGEWQQNEAAHGPR